MVEVETKVGKASISGNEGLTIVVIVLALVVGVIIIVRKILVDSGAAILNVPQTIIDGASKVIQSKDKGIEESAGRIDFDAFKTKIGLLPQTLINIGEIITPQTVLNRFASEGARFGESLEINNDRQRLESLNPITKSLVVVGEALPSSILGFSPYQAGIDFRNNNPELANTTYRAVKGIPGVGWLIP